jgi:hypothetical protein
MYIYTVMGNEYESNTEIYVGIERELVLDINKVITRWIERKDYDEDFDNPDEFKSYSLRVWEDGYLIKEYSIRTDVSLLQSQVQLRISLDKCTWVEIYDAIEGYINGGRITEVI